MADLSVITEFRFKGNQKPWKQDRLVVLVPTCGSRFGDRLTAQKPNTKSVHRQLVHPFCGLVGVRNVALVWGSTFRTLRQARVFTFLLWRFCLSLNLPLGVCVYKPASTSLPLQACLYKTAPRRLPLQASPHKPALTRQPVQACLYKTASCLPKRPQACLY